MKLFVSMSLAIFASSELCVLKTSREFWSIGSWKITISLKPSPILWRR